MTETQSPSHGHGHHTLDKLLPKSLSKRRRHRSKSKKHADDDQDAGGNGASGGKRHGHDHEDDDDEHRDRHERELEQRGRRFSTREQSTDSDDAHSAVFDNDGSGADARSFVSNGSSTDIDLKLVDSQHSSSASAARPVRPAPSQHPSLIGYLTTSSPAVQATHLGSPPKIRQGFRSKSRTRSTSRSRSRNRNRPEDRLSHDISDEAMARPSSGGIPEPPPRARVASSAERPPKSKTPKIETTAPVPPRTPPSADSNAPSIVNTPPTPTDTSNSRAFTASPDKRSPVVPVRDPAESGSPTRSPNAGIHRRSKSGGAAIGPSKLSNITVAPPSPSPDGTAVAGGDLTPSATGFFSSVISAAQSAANTLSSNMPGGGMGIGGPKKSPSWKAQNSAASSQVEIPDASPEVSREDLTAQKGSAVHTLGSGDLSLDQLGLAESPNPVLSPISAKFPDVVDTRVRSESAPVEHKTNELAVDEPGSRPRSLAESVSGDDQSRNQGDLAESKGSLNRSSSARSGLKAHRKRGSSVTTGGVGPPNSTPLQPAPTFGAPKLTGFAIASKKRNRDFHSFFKSVPDDDYLIEDYSCALQREILAHGRLYVSEGHLCFSSNILGWTTTLVMSFDEIVSVEKRSTALVFKNGLMISTLHAKHIFASFTSRDATYDLIINIWKLGHPTLKSTLNGVQLEGTGGDKTEKIDMEPVGLGLENENETPMGSESEEDSSDEDEEEFYDEEEDEDPVETQPTDLSGMEVEADKAVSRKVSTATVLNGGSTDGPKDASSSPPGAADFPGPQTHAPTECTDTAEHYDKTVGDDIIPAPLGKVYSLMFGSASPAWMSKWLSGDQKCLDVQVDDKKGLSMDNKSRTFTYIKPLYGPIGPKQTKCLVTENLETLDFEKGATMLLATRTPEVPNGTLFTVRTRYCLTWAENNSTRIQVNHTTEWSGKSWIKGTIEKNVNDGQAQYCKDLFASLKTAVAARGRSGTLTNGGTSKSKKKSKRSKANFASNEDLNDVRKKKEAEKQHWGILEPVRVLVEPLLDVVKPVITGNVMYGLLVGLLVASWFGFGFSPNKTTNGYNRAMDMYSPYRLAAYEEMWRREDSELWEWLEERAGLERLGDHERNTNKRAVEPRTLEERLREESLSEREVQEAIRVTEEKLKVLRQVVGKSKPPKHGASRAA